MTNASVWAKPDPDIAAAQKAQMALGPEPAPTVWAPMDDSAPRALPAQAAPHVIWAPPHTAQDDAMNAQPISMPDSGVNLHAGLEKVFPPAPEPTVALDPNVQHQIEGHEQNALERDYEKDSNPWGSPTNHPGVFGKIAHALSHATGGDTRRKWEEQGIANQINTQLGEESQQGLQGANTAHINAETQEVAPEAESQRDLQGAQVGNLESETKDRDAAAAMGPSLAAGYSHAVNEAVKAGRDPAQDPIVQHLADAITGLQKQTADKGLDHVSLQDQKGKPYAATYDPNKGEYRDAAGKVIANPIPYERPNVTNVNAGTKEAKEVKTAAYKAYTPALDSAERFDVMAQNYEDAMKNHDQQAMLSLLYNHMGMTMGLQKGARMTKDLIHEAQQSQPWLQGIQAKFDKDGYLSGVTLSPRQMQEMVHNAQGRYQADVKKSRSEAQYMGATDDGPKRDPSDATQRYYLSLAGRDPNKARQMMTSDGWTF